jgi:hypothetical protein
MIPIMMKKKLKLNLKQNSSSSDLQPQYQQEFVENSEKAEIELISPSSSSRTVSLSSPSETNSLSSNSSSSSHSASSSSSSNKASPSSSSHSTSSSLSNIYKNVRKNSCSPDPYAYFISVLKAEEIKQDENEIGLALKHDLDEQVAKYYTKNKPKFMQIVSPEDYDQLEDYTTHEIFEQNNEKAFKSIFKFSRVQAKKLDQRSATHEVNDHNHNNLFIF